MRGQTIGVLMAACLAGQVRSQWPVHKDPAGFTVQLPPGWKAGADPKSGRIDLNGPAREQVTIWPVFIPGTVEARPAAAVLRKLAGSLVAGATWGTPAPAGPAAIRMAGRAGDRAAVAALTWMASPKGTAAYVYVLAAPAAAYRQAEETFARILTGFRVTGAPSQGQASTLSYVRWQDPRESAFSLEFPSGWTASGGLFRFASVDIRGAWEAVSPDGEIRIAGGDAELPTFTEPTQMLMMGGFQEGSWYSPGYGVRMMVRRHVPGAAFAREYALGRAARGCAGVAITENRELPEAVAALNAVYARHGGLGVATELSAGEAAFTCRKAGRPMRGYSFAGILRTQMAGMPGGIWKAEYLAGYLAPEAKAPLAQSALEHAVQSIQINPQWAAGQQNLTANTSRIVSQTHAEISRIIDSSYWNRQAVMDELSRRRSNVILGVEDAIDPATGRQIKVESGANYYWIDHRGMIAGTETHTLPNLDFRELIRLP
ncbi:MAG: hypothetical protein AAB225_19120 [Acidobacteriota bacterium]